MGGPESKASPRRVSAREREEKALRLRMEGLTYAEIGRQLGVARQSAHRIVMRALARLNEKLAEDAEAVRRLELERLDALLATLWPKARAGNQAAIDRILRIMERRSKLLGLDAPKSVDLTTGGEPLRVVLKWEETGGDADA